MDFLNKLYESNYFGIGLFAVIAFLVVTFLIVLFFGKKDEKKRKLEATQSVNTKNTFEETSEAKPVEIPANFSSVEPINLNQPNPLNESTLKPIEPETIITPTTEPMDKIEPVAPLNIDNNEFVNNLNIEEPLKYNSVENFQAEPILTPVSPILGDQPEVTSSKSVSLEPTKIEIPTESLESTINESEKITANDLVAPVIQNEKTEPILTPITPIIEEEEPKLQINEEPVINTYYKPTAKPETETIQVPKIDFDSLAKSISKELDELENDSKKYNEVKITPLNEVNDINLVRQPETFSSVYVKEPIKEKPKGTIELPKKIDLPARKSE